MNVLAIETSCDETSIALVNITESSPLPKIEVLKSIVSSQIKIHAPFGGVVPSLAKREHIKNLPIIWKQFLKHPIVKKKEVDLMAVTVGPGLEPALWTGISFAKELNEKYFNKKVPLIGANHLYGHLFSFILSEQNGGNKKKNEDMFPMVSLIVSGGHTILGVLKNLKSFKKLGETKDDAVGECFDKVARLLGLPYPGGPEIEKISSHGNENAIAFPSPMIYQKNYDFSYSGLKTSVLYYMRGLGISEIKAIEKEDIAASFQNAAFKVLIKKTMRAVNEYKAKSITVGGGVSASKSLREMFYKEIKKDKINIKLYLPPFEYCGDNAVMIALAGYLQRSNKKNYPLKANGILNMK